jgi:hypothetical protein
MSKQTVSITVDEDVVDALKKAAEVEDRTLSAQCGRILRRWVQNQNLDVEPKSDPTAGTVQ